MNRFWTRARCWGLIALVAGVILGGLALTDVGAPHLVTIACASLALIVGGLSAFDIDARSDDECLL